MILADIIKFYLVTEEIIFKHIDTEKISEVINERLDAPGYKEKHWTWESFDLEHDNGFTYISIGMEAYIGCGESLTCFLTVNDKFFENYDKKYVVKMTRPF